MMDLKTIQAMSREAGEKAAKHHKHPYMYEKDDVGRFPPFPFPNLGDYCPPNWEREETYFVDKWGLGRDDEPALTIPRFCQLLKPGKGYAIIEEGEFQVIVGEFTKH